MSETATVTVKWGRTDSGFPMASTGTLTGASTALVVSWLEERKGASTVDLLFDRLQSNDGPSLSRGQVSKRGKVRYSVHTSVLEEVAELTDASDETLREIGHDAAHNVETVIPGAGLMLRLASPKRLLKRANTLWTTYADFGNVEVINVEKGSARLRIYGFDTHPHFCRTLEGLFEGLLERTGAKSANVRETTHDDMDDGCTFHGTWS